MISYGTDCLSFQVSVTILGGLMALGYEIGTIMKRTSTSYSDDKITIKLDQIEGMDRTFVLLTPPPPQTPTHSHPGICSGGANSSGLHLTCSPSPPPPLRSSLRGTLRGSNTKHMLCLWMLTFALMC